MKPENCHSEWTKDRGKVRVLEPSHYWCTRFGERPTVTRVFERPGTNRGPAASTSVTVAHNDAGWSHGQRRPAASHAADGSRRIRRILIRMSFNLRWLSAVAAAVVLGGSMAACASEPAASPSATPTTSAVKTPQPAQPDASPTPTETPAGLSIARSEKQRVTSPDVSTSGLADLVAGNSAFAFDLYRALSEEPGNLFYSPYSISLALAMTYAGARGETERQMADTLHFVLPQDRLHPAFNGLDLELARRGEGAAGRDEKGFRLNIVNAIWGQEDYEFLVEFLDVLAENYGAGPRLLDFAGEPEESRVTINDWVSEQSEGRIEDLVPQGVIDELTRLVLTNAIYFNAAWLYPFTESLTKDGAFHLLDGGEVMVPMMRRTARFGLATGDGYQAVELPYDGGELSMVILLPDTGQFEAFESVLDADLVHTVTEGLVPTRVALTMPRFEFESDFTLGDALGAMGMPTAFIPPLGPCTSEMADFSGMTSTCELYIKEVVHKAFVSVDEAGTEAAAATAVVMSIGSMPPSVTIDRPFVFLIRDIETGAVLFVGRVVDPGA